MTDDPQALLPDAITIPVPTFDREGLYYQVARAYCIERFDYDLGVYNTPDDRESHIDLDATSTALEERFRATVDLMMRALGCGSQTWIP